MTQISSRGLSCAGHAQCSSVLVRLGSRNYCACLDCSHAGRLSGGGEAPPPAPRPAGGPGPAAAPAQPALPSGACCFTGKVARCCSRSYLAADDEEGRRQKMPLMRLKTSKVICSSCRESCISTARTCIFQHQMIGNHKRTRECIATRRSLETRLCLFCNFTNYIFLGASVFFLPPINKTTLPQTPLHVFHQ